MQFIQGIPRNQLQIVSLEDKISSDNPVRFIDAFVGYIELEKIGFSPKILKTEGRPSFDMKVFLKLYLYGYILGVPELIAKLQKWNSPYKRRGLFSIKTTILKLFIVQIIFGTKQNASKFSWS